MKAWLVYDLVSHEHEACDECAQAPTEFELLGVYLNEAAARNHALNSGVRIEETELIP